MWYGLGCQSFITKENQIMNLNPIPQVGRVGCLTDRRKIEI